jgi:hypothetical protein
VHRTGPNVHVYTIASVSQSRPLLRRSLLGPHRQDLSAWAEAGFPEDKSEKRTARRKIPKQQPRQAAVASSVTTIDPTSPGCSASSSCEQSKASISPNAAPSHATRSTPAEPGDLPGHDGIHAAVMAPW